MLRLGLTGNLGSGKSTVAALLAAHGAHTLSSDAIGRELMQPGQTVFDQIVSRFGLEVLTPDGTLNRRELSRLAFAECRVEELNASVHPSVITRQAELAEEIFLHNPNAIVVVESALIFETKHAGTDWNTRFDRILLVTAPESQKIVRFIRRQHLAGEPSPEERRTLEAEAHRRLALQIPDSLKASRVDYIVANDRSIAHLEEQIDALWPTLEQIAHKTSTFTNSLQ